MTKYRKRQLGLLASVCIAVMIFVFYTDSSPALNDGYLGTNDTRQHDLPPEHTETDAILAVDALAELSVKGRAPKTNYSRAQFGDGWSSVQGCDTRNIILNRDLTKVEVDEKCRVVSGVLNSPYSGDVVNFKRGSTTSADVQIDHVVALADAWQKGAQGWTYAQRVGFSNDPLNLLAVDGASNQKKGASDAASWLPSYKPFRCQYVARQISVKRHYDLWVTEAERVAMSRVLSTCLTQAIIVKI